MRFLPFFADTEAAGQAVSAIVAAGIVPGAIEMMDRLSIKAAEQTAHAGYRLDADPGMLSLGPSLSATLPIGQLEAADDDTVADDVDLRAATHARIIVGRCDS